MVCLRNEKNSSSGHYNIKKHVVQAVVEQGIWRIRTNQELRELYRNFDIVANVKRKRLECIGHVVRMEQGTTYKKIFESKPEESRRRGRPRQRCLEDVEKDQREKKVKRRRQKAVDKNNGRP
jgi:hypothetical protein